MHLGLIGHGNIAGALLALAADPGQGVALSRVTLLTRPGRAAAARACLGGLPGDVVDTSGALIAARPDLVVECASQDAVRADGAAVLRAGIDLVVVSIGALADDALGVALRDAAARGGARLILPAGAVGGIDILSALAAAGGLQLTYRGTKPPAAWKGTPAEGLLDLDGLDAPATFFRGTARQAARDYPKNANVAATLALAGGGFDATRVELIADPAAPGNLHAFEAEGPLARISMQIENRASAGNVKTSAATIYSVLRELRNRQGPIAI